MKIPSNVVEPSLEDILMTAIQLAAEELAEAYPQPQGDSVGRWKAHLIQQATKKQGQMTEEQRFIYNRDVICKERCFP